MSEIEQIAATLAEQLAVQAGTRDAERRLPMAEMKVVKESGFLAARLPLADGGLGASLVETARAFIAVAKADPNVAQALQPHFLIVEMLAFGPRTDRHGAHFAEMAKGRLFANAHAERGGTRTDELATRLVREGSGLRLKGTKFYSTGALFADYLYVSALDEEDRFVMAVLPPDRPGLTILDDWDGMGQRTTASGTTILDSVEVRPGELLPPMDLQNRRHYFGAAAQLLHAAIEGGIGLAALDEAALFAATKARAVPDSGVERAADDPYVLHAIGEIAVVAHAGVAMIERAAAVVDRAALAWQAGDASESLLAEASIAVAEAKAAAEHGALRASEMLYRAGGASSTRRGLNLDRHWRNARTHTTHDPVAYKYKAIGDFHVNGRFPPISTKI